MREITRRTALGGAAALVIGGAGTLPAAAGPALTNPGPAAALTNPGFEQGLAGWKVVGKAAKLESGGRSGDRLTHWAATGYRVTTRQTVELPARGWWTVSVWAKAGGNTSTLSVKGCGATASTVIAQTVQDDKWVRSAVSVYAERRQHCTVELSTAGPGGTWASFDDVGLEPGRVSRTIRGGDLSGLAKNEAFGATYADARGRRGDAVKILAGAGMNLGRLKVWVDPADGFNDKAHVVATGQRIKAAGMKLLVDFHYSDRWTDPGAQGVPAAWRSLTPAQMAEALAAHTRDVLRALKKAGATADYVQVGNEINPGMLWPWGQTWDVDPSDEVVGAQWDNLAAFLTAGSRAVKSVDPSTKVLLHLTNINNGIDSLIWWFDEVVARNVPFDLIGLSYYGYWHGSLADLQEAITTLSARYDRDVLNVETAYPFTLADDAPTFENIIDLPAELVPGYPATPAGQSAAYRAVQDAVAAAEGGRGIGTVYWEPAWTAVAGAGWDPADPASGNAWENQALFDFSGKLLPAARNLSPASKG